MRDMTKIRPQQETIVGVLNHLNTRMRLNGGYNSVWHEPFIREQHKIYSNLWYSSDVMWELLNVYPDQRKLHYAMYQTISALINLMRHHDRFKQDLKPEEIGKVFDMVHDHCLAGHYQQDPIGLDVITGAYHNLYAKLFSVASADFHTTLLQYTIPQEVVDIETRTDTKTAVFLISNICACFNITPPSLEKDKMSEVLELWKGDKFHHNFLKAHDEVFHGHPNCINYRTFDYIAREYGNKPEIVKEQIRRIRDIIKDQTTVKGITDTSWGYHVVLDVLKSLERDGIKPAPSTVNLVAHRIDADMQKAIKDIQQIALGNFWQDNSFTEFNPDNILFFIIEDLKTMMGSF